MILVMMMVVESTTFLMCQDAMRSLMRGRKIKIRFAPDKSNFSPILILVISNGRTEGAEKSQQHKLQKYCNTTPALQHDHDRTSKTQTVTGTDRSQVAGKVQPSSFNIEKAPTNVEPTWHQQGFASSEAYQEILLLLVHSPAQQHHDSKALLLSRCSAS